MRVANLATLIALPALISAQDQYPFLDKAKAWFDMAQEYVKAATAAPAQAASAKVAEVAVTPLTWTNWKSTLVHSGQAGSAIEPWMVFVTGGNRTCGGMCGKADAAWNKSVTAFVSDPTAPSLAVLDCETEEMLCGSWGTTSPSIWTFMVPSAPLPDQSRAPTRLTIHRLNFTSVTSDDIIKIHKNKDYLTEKAYEGALHPFDGWLQEYGLVEPFAYFMYYFSKIPSWAMMIAVSLFSRRFVNQRFPQEQRR